MPGIVAFIGAAIVGGIMKSDMSGGEKTFSIIIVGGICGVIIACCS